MAQALNFKLNHWLLATIGAALLLFSASCGGGASVGLPDNTPAPGTADLHGQLVQGSGDRAVSAAGEGLAGVLVSLIDSTSGQQAGTDTTDLQGRFEFKGVPSGDGMLVKVEFTSPQDLDGDGQPDNVELLFPINLADQSVSELKQQIDLGDSDGDSHMDCIDVDTDLTDNLGRHENHRERHRHRGDDTVSDTNNDGRFDGNDQRFPDEDHDGLPDGRERLGSVMARGQIEALTDTSITVATVEFAITDATKWHLRGAGEATQADFSVGMWVRVHGFTTADGVLVAHRVAAHGAHDPGDDNGAGNDPGDSAGGDGRPDHDDDPGDVDNDNDGQPDGSGDDPGAGNGDDPNGGDDDPGDVGNGDDPSGGDPDNSGDDPGVGNGDDPNGGDDDPGDVGNGDDPSGGDPDNSGDDPGDAGNGDDPSGGDDGNDAGGGDDPSGGGDPNVP